MKSADHAGACTSLFPLYLLICAVPATAGYLFKPGAWYRNLSLPPWTPSDMLFPVIWTVLYLLMSLAAALMIPYLAWGTFALALNVSVLRRSYRDGDKVKNETLGNLSHLPIDVIELVRCALRGETFVPATEAFEITQSRGLRP
ncbi:MAG: TspO/MBR family protein [Chromatocurvus sp.]